ncbi:MAG TPA: hypothetical protein DHV77_01565 [Erysipelotrichaceae bacterium]|nr:hypothetical protein [Erysipelotrichaceae bacterium]
MTKEEAIKYIRFCMCEGRLVGNTKPIIDEKWQAGTMAIKALEHESVLDKIRAEIMSKDGLEEALEIIDKYKAESKR